MNDPNNPDVLEPKMIQMARRLGMRANCVVDLTKLDEDRQGQSANEDG